MNLITDRRLHVALAAALLVRGSLFGWDASIIAALVFLGCLTMFGLSKDFARGSRRGSGRINSKSP